MNLLLDALWAQQKVSGSTTHVIKRSEHLNS